MPKRTKPHRAGQGRSPPRERRPVRAGWRSCQPPARRQGKMYSATIKRLTPALQAPPHGAASALGCAEKRRESYTPQGLRRRSHPRGTRGAAPPRERRPVPAGWRYGNRPALRRVRMYSAAIKRPTPTSEAPPHGAPLALPSPTEHDYVHTTAPGAPTISMACNVSTCGHPARHRHSAARNRGLRGRLPRGASLSASGGASAGSVPARA